MDDLRSEKPVQVHNPSLVDLIYRPIIHSMTECSGAMCDAYTAIGTEWLTFLNRRLHTDLMLPAKLSKCSSSQELMEQWSEFMNSAANEYRTEFTRLTEIGTSASQRAVSALHSGVNARAMWPKRGA